MSFLARLLPFQYWIAGAVAASLLTFAGVQTLRLASEKREHLHDLAETEKARSMQLAGALMETERQRAIYEGRLSAIHGVVNETIRIAQDIAADADAARGADERLRARTAALTAAARQARSHPAATPGSPAAPDPLDVLADVQRRLVETARELALVADERGNRGLACERIHDSLGK